MPEGVPRPGSPSRRAEANPRDPRTAKLAAGPHGRVHLLYLSTDTPSSASRAPGELPGPQRFYFEDGSGAVAANLREFHLGACPAGSVDTHARRRDFSRWIRLVLQDEELADIIADAENWLGTGQLPAEALRDAARVAIDGCYLE